MAGRFFSGVDAGRPLRARVGLWFAFWLVGLLGLVEGVHRGDLEFGEQMFDSAGVVEPGLVAGQLFAGEGSW